MGCVDVTLAIQGAAERIDHTANHLLATRNTQQLARPTDLTAFLDIEVIAKDDDAHRVLVEVESLTELPVGKLELLTGDGVAQAIDPGNAIPHFQNPTNLGQIDFAAIVANLFGDHRRDLVYIELHDASSK